MLKHLFLLRHGNAPRAANESDADRKLSQLGYKEAEQVADFLNISTNPIDLIKSSDSVRTRQTVSKLLENFSSKPKVEFTSGLYNVSGYEILEIIKSTSTEINNLMIVGHNPGITSILDLINPTGNSQDILRARDYEVTCKMVVVKLEQSDWETIDLKPSTIESVFYPNNSKNK